MKQRLSAIDIRALVAALKRKGLIGMKINNIYDISGKQYLIKLQRGSKKQMLLIESGVRFHTTSFQRDKNQIPSAYSMKLRKYIRSKYISDIKQLGTDRVVLIQICQGDEFFNLILQFYAQGNIILTDRQFVILALLRSHKFDDQIKIAVKEKYPFSLAANQDVSSVICTDQAIINTWMQAKHHAQVKEKEQGSSKKKKGGNSFNLKALLMKIVPFINTQYAEHALKAAGVAQLNKKIEDSDVDVLGKSARFLVQLVQNIDEFAKGQFQEDKYKKDEVKDGESKVDEDGSQELELEADKQQEGNNDNNKQVFTANGYILATRFKPKQQVASTDNAQQQNQFAGLKFQDFSPVMLQQYKQASQKDKQLLQFQSFDQCIDIFFSQMDIQKFEHKVQQKQNQIWKKVERMKKDQQSRIVGLKQEQSLSIYKAKLLQSKLYELQGIITILNLMVHSGLDWTQIWRMIKQQQRSQNQFALSIHRLVLQKKIVELLLYSQNDQYFDDFSDIAQEHRDLTNQVFKIDIDLTLSAQMNINRYFQIKKKAVSKEIKTKSAAQTALKQAQKHANKEMKVHQQAVKMEQLRKVYWFEKFDWFVTSENYLVIAGKNAQQNEVLVKRYMNKSDIYVHAEINGAATTIVKNHNQQEPVPPVTLNQAAAYAVCHSSAWNAKVPVAAYWVFPSQVSKTPPSGEYLPTGSFMIRGKKNFLLPPKLEMGVCVLFKFDQQNLENHANERGIKVQGDGESMMDLEDIANEDDFIEEQEEEEEGDQGEDEGDNEGNQDEKVNKQQGEQVQQAASIQDEEIADEQNLTNQSQNQENQQIQTIQEQDPLTSLPRQTKIQEQGQQQKHQQINPQQKQHPKNQQNHELSHNQKSKGKQDKNKKQQSQPQQPQHQQQLPRGKKFKIKKMKQKYADQDEQQKQLKMQLLGSKNIQSKKQKQQKPQQKKWQQEKKKQYKGPRKPKQISPEQQQMAKQAAMKEMTGSLKEINLLTGLPRENDTILYALTMCAPYSSITNYKYKVKLLPGTIRRGKAQKTIKQLFTNQSKADKNEVQNTLIRSINDQQMTMNMIGSIRVFAPGLNKMKQQKKK